jgi:hypothetical protein
VLAGADHVQAASVDRAPVGGARQHAEAAGVDEADRVQLDDDRLPAGGRPGEPIPKQRNGRDIHLPGHRDERELRFPADLDGQPTAIHDVAPCVLPRPMFSRALVSTVELRDQASNPVNS